MGWKAIDNNHPPHKEISYSGECPRFHKQATVTGSYFGKKWVETDHYPTYHLEGCSCTLIPGIGSVIVCPYKDRCTLIPPEYD